MSEQDSTCAQTVVQFVDVDGYDGYQVGSDGSVWTDRIKARNELGRYQWIRSDYWIRLRHSMPTTGYPQVTLIRDGKGTSTNIHGLVLRAFVGPRPLGMQACHRNGVRSDNRVENLRWDTVVNNHADKLAHGTHQCGSKAGNSKLKEAEVIAIIALKRRGVSSKRLARWFGVTFTTVDSIVARKTWRHVHV